MVFYPDYPNLGLTVAKFRRKGPVKDMAPEAKRAYAAAIFSAVKRLQNAKLTREVSVPRCPCASKTWHNGGAAILKAIRHQHRTALYSAITVDHRRRTDDYVSTAYRLAMKSKRESRMLA